MMHADPNQIEAEIIGLQKERAQTIQHQLDIRQKISAINAKLVNTVTRSEYSRLESERKKLTSSVIGSEQTIAGLNANISALSSSKESAKRALKASGHDDRTDSIKRLVALRDHYESFAADFTRVSSMRAMAADFVMKLNPIIKDM